MRDQILRPIREIFEEEKNRISNITDWKAKRKSVIGVKTNIFF